MSKLNAAQIKYYREALGLTQSELSKELGISTTMLSSIERGDRRLTPMVANKAFQKFDESRHRLARVIAELGELADALQK
ncbi:helix-turn-helix transcriptional regulator [Lysinibacillus sp. CNPSo 3705]|uniref:helix-turn-helix transcriptional regulator n=1 Tax=Lysinibacillus sp. CNPSo 3705 TaxID=3028148 RepID=UPI002363CEB2|nr:helix-turn-helix transcriptional regulator [Lysinibacillus sp. CNPSo 3705]MDD1504743.1 helix-turn-helix transcriptional regulator [Lysinibacillus sp. CNPSo 3705]